jgi:hypothetical protein
MTRPCCARRRVSGVTASLLPAALLLFLPKCPLCLAAWLTVATGIGISAGGVVWLRAILLLLWILAVTTLVWRRQLDRNSIPATAISKPSRERQRP